MRRTLLIASLCLLATMARGQAVVKLGDTTGAPFISKHIYGQFAEHLGRSIYDGFYRNGKIRLDVVKALKAIQVPNLRWPGGCFADQYHWRDGLGSKTRRPVRVNTTWGMVPEDNSFGTHEFLQLCGLLGCEPYIAGNVGTGSPQEMADWLEYLNYKGKSTLTDLRRQHGHAAPYGVSLWGIGNESWGCGGDMKPEFYTQLYRQYYAFCQQYPGAPALRPIVSGANADDYHWTEVCMRDISPRMMYGLSLHYYTWINGNWPPSGSATTFGEEEYFKALQQAFRMEEIVNKHAAIMDQYDPKKKVALLVDEWGIWTAPEPGTNPAFLYQQNSLRDALIAASTLNIFNNHADRVRGANLAQTVNVIQSVVLTKGDQMLLTPTYWVFDLYKVHQDARQLPLKIESPDYSYKSQKLIAVNASASMDKAGITHISLVNIDPAKTITVKLAQKGQVNGRILTAPKFNSINTFEKKEEVKPAVFSDFKTEGDQLLVTLPAKSIVQLSIK